MLEVPRLRWIALASLAIAACSSTDPPSPAQGCEDFLDAWCNQNASCQAASERANYRENCEFASHLEIDCSQIKSLGTTYGQCMNDLVNLSCSAYVAGMGLPSPSSCRGVLLK